MADRKNHITNLEDYKRYLDNQMTPTERHDFEKQLLDDAFESEAFDGLSQLTSEEVSSDLNALSRQVKAKAGKKGQAIYWRIAATLLMLAVFSFIIYLTIDFEPKPEIAQNKKVESEKPETEIRENAPSFSPDNDPSGDNESDVAPAIIAETKREEGSSKSNDKQDKAQVEFKDIEFEDNIIAETSDELEVDQKQLEPEPLEFAELALEQSPRIEEIAEIEIETDREIDKHSEDKKTGAKVMSAAPAALKKAESSSARSRSAPEVYHLRTITGIVSSVEDGERLPGVNVIVKGSTNGTVTDADGDYSISIPGDEKASLVFSYVGFISEEVEVAANDGY